MLKEIRSNVFNSYNGESVIKFHDGLNIVLGTENGDNSIGKSSLLMIIDFIFGGNDYVSLRELRDIIQNVGDHEFKYIFEFDNTDYYFIRSTRNPDFVSLCDNTFSLITDMYIDDYLSFLSKHYSIGNLDIDFRQAVSHSIRIDRKNTIDSKNPLRSDNNATKKDSIIDVFNLFDEFKDLKIIIDKINEVKYNHSELKRNPDYHFIEMAKTKRDVEHNEVRITQLLSQITIVEKENSPKIDKINSVNSEEITNLTHSLKKYHNQKNILNSRIRVIEENNASTTRILSKNIDQLKHFFPAANIKDIEDVSNFHQRMERIMIKEKDTSLNDYRAKLSLVEEQINLINNKLTNLKLAENNEDKAVSADVLATFAKLTTEYDNLVKANQIAEQDFKFVKELDALNDSYNSQLELKSSSITESLNKTMEEINKNIFLNEHSSPILKASSNSYVFQIQNDHSGEVSLQSMVIFDLALLQLTKMPIIVHDTNLTGVFSKPSLENLLNNYNSFSQKQIFIALEEQNSLSDEANELINEKCVYKLSLNNRLYGKFWG